MGFRQAAARILWASFLGIIEILYVYNTTWLLRDYELSIGRWVVHSLTGWSRVMPSDFSMLARDQRTAVLKVPQKDGEDWQNLMGSII